MVQKQILIIDDLVDNLKLLASIFNETGYDVRMAVNGQMALMSMEKQVPDLVLLDVRMPGMDGFEVCQQIKNTPHLAQIPVIFISALTETQDKVKGLQAGGADFITKPFQKEEVLARINTHMKLAELQENLKRSAENLEQEVRLRTRELTQTNDQLRQEIAQRIKTEKALSREVDINMAMAKVSSSLMVAENLNDIADIILKYAILLTRSKNGFVSIIDADTRDQIIHSFSPEFQNTFKAPGREYRFGVNPEGEYTGLMGHALNTKQAFVSNNTEGLEWVKGLPLDHLAVHNFLSVPAVIKGELLGQICLANCPESFSNRPLKIVTQLAMLFAVAVDRKHTENKLRESEQRFQMIADYAHGWEVWTDPDNNVIWTNPGIERVSGFTAKEYSTREDRWKHLVFEEDYSEMVTNFQKSLKNRTSENDISFRIYHKDGNVRWVSLSYQPIYSDSGEYLGLRSSIRDIHERKMAEQSLKKSQDRLQTLLKLSQMTELTEQALADFALEEAVRLTGSQGGYLHFYDEDKKNVQLKSWSSEVLNQCALPDSYHYPLEAAGLWADCIRMRRPVIHNNYDMEQNKKGLPEGHFPIKRHMSIPVFNEKKIIAIAGVANKETDYTQSDIDHLSLLMTTTWQMIQKKKTEKQLRENEKRFRTIFDQAPMGIVLIQAETGKFSKVNPKFTILSGYREDELLKMDIQSIIYPEDLETALNHGILLNKKKISIYRLEQRYVQKDGSLIWVNVTVVPLWGEDALFGQNLAMVEDISARRETQQSLKASEKSLRTLSSKLQETEELFRKQLSRELHDQAGQNLTALNLNLTLLENQLKKGQLDKMQERLLDSIVLVEETSQTIRDVMADLRPAVLDDYGLKAALRWHCERFSQRYSVQVVMDDIHLDSRLPETVESAFFRICQEAMNNVAKHARADQVWISLNDTTDYLYMSIKDDGIGFDSRLLELTMDRKGWGILNITERVQALGGTADISSQPGKGTTFSIKIRKSKYEN